MNTKHLKIKWAWKGNDCPPTQEIVVVFLLFLTDFRSEDNRDTEECFLLSKYVQHDFFCCSLCVIMWVTSTFSNNRPQRPPVHIVWEVVSHRLRAYLWIILCAYVLSAERWSLYDRWQQITKSGFFFPFLDSVQVASRHPFTVIIQPVTLPVLRNKKRGEKMLSCHQSSAVISTSFFSLELNMSSCLSE